MEEYMVTYSISGTLIIEAKSEEDAREQAKALTNEEIVENVKVALESDCYYVGSVEKIEE